jgi:hypothetical protein
VRLLITLSHPISWTEALPTGLWAYDNVASPSNPGLVDPDGTGYQNAYKLRTDSIVIGTVTHSTEPYVPAKDYFCRDRAGHAQNSPGVYEP